MRSGPKKHAPIILMLTLCCLAASGFSCDAGEGADQVTTGHDIQLPEPSLSGDTSLEQAVNQRRSVRRFSDRPLGIEEIGQLLWAAQGITEPGRGLRSAPSAGATYPLEMLVAAGNVTGLPAGLYRYRPQAHSLEVVAQGDPRPDMHRAALNQSSVLQAPAVFVITALPERTETRYGQRTMRYVLMEAGHAAQNLCLQAVALGMGTVVIGAFHDADMAVILDLPSGEPPLYLIPTGIP